MFHHVKQLQFNARVSGPDPAFAKLLLEQFGGPNGELKAAMQYFVQGFACRQPYPDKYDLLMDIAAEEFSHLEIVGATITMLLEGVNGRLKDAADSSGVVRLTQAAGMKDDLLHQASIHPAFVIECGGGPALTDAQGQPWNGMYVNANGDLTVDLRSNIAAESRAKIVYEYLLQFTGDPQVRESLKFLMTREIAHFQMFSAALDSIAPNFPPGVLQGDPRFENKYFNLSKDGDARGPWNQGQGPWTGGEEWVFIDEPLPHVADTRGLIDEPIEGCAKTAEQVEQMDQEVSRLRTREVELAVPQGANQWSTY
jgi:Mn-containing catalase